MRGRTRGTCLEFQQPGSGSLIRGSPYSNRTRAVYSAAMLSVIAHHFWSAYWGGTSGPRALSGEPPASDQIDDLLGVLVLRENHAGLDPINVAARRHEEGLNVAAILLIVDGGEPL